MLTKEEYLGFVEYRLTYEGLLSWLKEQPTNNSYAELLTRLTTDSTFQVELLKRGMDVINENLMA